MDIDLDDAVNLFFNERPAKLYSSSNTDFQAWAPRKKVTCKDGFTVSIQASKSHYCQPRLDDANWYSAVELGYPSEAVHEWLEYMDGDPDTTEPTDTVYGYVPVDIVNATLRQHGGIDYNKTEENL